MPGGNVTKRSVDALKPEARDAFLWDAELRGFGVKVTPAGAKSYVYSYRVGGREAAKRRYTIGRHGSPWTPTTARVRAEQLALLVAQGVDPMAAEKSRRTEAVTLAFDAYAERFIREYLVQNWPESWKSYAVMLRNKAAPAFAGKSIKAITRGDVSACITSLPLQMALRRNTFSILRRLFRWAVGQGDLDQSPMREMDPPAAPASRNRVLSDAELGHAWRAAEAIGYPFGPLFQLLIATGQRREEVAALDWRELNRSSATWTLPSERAKNNQAHLVPLNAAAVGVLDAIALIHSGETEGDLVWPKSGLVLTTTGTTPISGYSKAKTRLDATINDAECELAGREGREPELIEPWRMHDLRRTVATGLQRLGVRFEVTEAVLNHTSGARSGVAGIYQRHDWKDEKRAALDAWNQHLINCQLGNSL